MLQCSRKNSDVTEKHVQALEWQEHVRMMLETSLCIGNTCSVTLAFLLWQVFFVEYVTSFMVGGYASGNVSVSINEVELRQARLVPGWVNVLRQVSHLCAEPAARPTQSGHPSVGRCSEYQQKLGSNQVHHAMPWATFMV